MSASDEQSTPAISGESIAYSHMHNAFQLLNGGDLRRSREMSLAVTNLEQAMMWLQSDRANKGEFAPFFCR